MKAVFRKNIVNAVTVTFMTVYDQVISTAMIELDNISVPAEPEIPFRNGYTAVEWDYTEDGKYGTENYILTVISNVAAADCTTLSVKPKYTPVVETCTITVIGGVADQASYTVNDIVTATPDSPALGEKFSHWVKVEENNTETILSYNSVYKFFAEQDMTIKAKYVTDTTSVAVSGTTAIINKTADSTKQGGHKYMDVI